ncbi:ash family protein [Escherichia coli]|uniref:ash family protein n=1 Tax=Escherichia coli TaxID=562 RepID=UPI002867B22F|nr:ash family protein [Escherichia coli]
MSAPAFSGLWCTVSMVALVGQPKGWPVSLCAGIPTPASVTAPYECRNSGGDSLNLHEEAAKWLRPQSLYALNLPFIFWLFAVPI